MELVFCFFQPLLGRAKYGPRNDSRTNEYLIDFTFRISSFVVRVVWVRVFRRSVGIHVSHILPVRASPVRIRQISGDDVRNPNDFLTFRSKHEYRRPARRLKITNKKCCLQRGFRKSFGQKVPPSPVHVRGRKHS